MTTRMWLAAAAITLGAAGTSFGQRQEVGLTMGTLLSQSRDLSGGRVESGRGMALQANYGFRLIGGDRVALYAETHFLASPQRNVTSGVGTASTDYASLYVTPGARIKFAPNARFSPWVSIGGGYAQSPIGPGWPTMPSDGFLGNPNMVGSKKSGGGLDSGWSHRVPEF